MSAITSEWPLVIAEEAAVRPFRDDGGYSRAEEFRIALDRYMAGYIDQQRRRAGMIGEVTTRHAPLGWLRNRSVFAKTSRTSRRHAPISWWHACLDGA
jgi:hypothetical protein